MRGGIRAGGRRCAEASEGCARANRPLSASAARAGSREANDAGGDRRQSSRPSSVKPQPSSGSVEDAASVGTLSMSRSSGERALPHAKSASPPATRRRTERHGRPGVAQRATRDLAASDESATSENGGRARDEPTRRRRREGLDPSVKHARRFFSRRGPMACDVAARSAEQWGNLTRHSRVAISPSEVWLACP